MKQPLAALLDQASKLRKREDKIAFLRANSSKPMHITLQYALHPGVKWLLPEGEVPFKPAQKWDDQDSHFYLEARKLYLFIEGGYPGKMSQTRREELFIQMLEGIDARDAHLLVAIKDKKLPFEGLDYDIVKEAFPGLLP